MSKRDRRQGQRAATPPAVPRQEETPRAPSVGGRLSIDNNLQTFGNTPVILPPLDYENGWRTLNLDTRTLDTVSPTKLIEYLANLSPELSRAVWDFLRQCNPGWTVTAFRSGGERVNDPRGQAVLDAFFATLRDRHGAVDVVLGRLFIAAFMRGAFFAEIVLDEAGRVGLDLATPDPATVRFRRTTDPVYGPRWQAGQWQWGRQSDGLIPGFVPLDRPTIAYIPLDPFPGNPYGRSPAAPGVFPALFLLGLLHDLRRVVAQQGWPRLDIALDLEKLRAGMPLDIQNDARKFKMWVDDTITDVQRVFTDLPPDAAYVHVSPIAVNRPTGAVDASSLGAVGGIIAALERMLARALKTMPLLMGIAEGTAESQSNRQYEAHIQSIRAVQHLGEQLLERLLDLLLRAAGIPASVEFRFAENRASEELRDAQVQQLKLTNAGLAYDRGLISQDEQAQMALGRDTADQQEPRVSKAAAPVTAAAQAQPEPGITRQAPGRRASTPLTPATRAKITPEGAALPDVPETITIGDDKRAVEYSPYVVQEGEA